MQISTQQVPSSGRLYRELAVLLAKHGGRVLADKVNLAPSTADDLDRGEEFAQDLEGLGPTFVKLGQLLSTRADIFAPDTLDALERLQDDVEPLPREAIAQVIEAEFGTPPERLFRSFEPMPLASASLGQVHCAVLHSGTARTTNNKKYILLITYLLISTAPLNTLSPPVLLPLESTSS